VEEKHGVAAFAFGAPKDLPSNIALGKIAAQKTLLYNASLFTQTDIPIQDHRIDFTFVKLDLGAQPPTYYMAKEAILWAVRKEVSILDVVAQPDHLYRVMRDLVYWRDFYKMKERIVIRQCKEELEGIGDEMWFSLASEQARTQTRQEWEKREERIMRMPFWMYRAMCWVQVSL
jgi:hypothetical protein